MRVGNNTSTSLTRNTVSPLLHSLFTHGCLATHNCNTIIKFAGDRTVVGLTTDND